MVDSQYLMVNNGQSKSSESDGLSRRSARLAFAPLMVDFSEIEWFIANGQYLMVKVKAQDLTV